MSQFLKYLFVCLAQDGIRAAKRSIQIEIQVAVHKIYQQLSATLERALQANKHHIGKQKADFQTRCSLIYRSYVYQGRLQY